MPPRTILLLLLAAACASPSARYELELRAWLRSPGAGRDQRAAHLQAMAREAQAPAGVRLAAVHQSLRAGQPIDAGAWLDAEARAFPGAERFLASYRLSMTLPQRAATRPPRGVVLVLVIDRTRQRDVAADLLATVERPLRLRGYYVVPVEVGPDWVAWLGGALSRLFETGVEPAALAHLAAAGVDRCLQVDVLDFVAHEVLAVESVRHDVRYRMHDTATGAIVWERAAIGSYERRPPSAFADDDDTFFYPSSVGVAFDDQVEFVRALNRGILRTVPHADA